MNWISNLVRPKIRSFLRRETPENLWIKCPETGQLVFYKDVEANQFVIPSSNYHMLGDFLRQQYARAFFTLRVKRCIPAFDFLFFRRFDQRPQFDQTGRGVGQRFVFWNSDHVCGDAFVNFASAEYLIDRAEHCGTGSERVVKAQEFPAQIRRIELLREQPPHHVEGLGRRTLK